MKLSFAFPAAIAALCLGASFAAADDKTDKVPDAPKVKAAAKARVLVFGEGAARFNVERDASAGRMTFHLADPLLRIEGAPVVVMTTDSGPREVTLVAVDGQPGAWVWSDDAVKTERFDGTMRVVVAGRTYTSPLATVWTSETVSGGVIVEPAVLTERVVLKARYGGRVLALPDCGASVEVVQDPATGTLTIYSFEDVVVTEAPVITITESKGSIPYTLARVEGKNGVWMIKNETFKVTTTSARLRLLVNGKPCETALVYGKGRGGQTVLVAGGPSFELVRDPKAGYYTFYPDETFNGKAYTVENPTVVVNGHTHNLTRVEGEPRAWRLIGLDTAGSDSRDAQLNFTLFGKTLSTRVGFWNVGVGVK